MQLETKAQISKVTLSLLVLVSSIFALGVLAIVLCAGFDINPFKETITGFLIAGFIGLIGIAIILVLLNISVSISLIADSKIKEMQILAGKGAVKKWLSGMIVLSLLLLGLIFFGTYSSKDKYLQIVRNQADEVLKDNDNLVEEIGDLLKSTKKEDYKKLSSIIEFLQKQRDGLPQVQIIYSGDFLGKTAFYVANSYFNDYDSKTDIKKIYYSCDKAFDCDYLKKFFASEKTDILQHYIMRNDEFYIYIPIENKEGRFIVLFSKNNRYGKIGSS